MKFTNYLKEIDNVSIFPLVSLIIFVSVFVIASLYALTADKNKMNDNAQIPLK